MSKQQTKQTTISNQQTANNKLYSYFTMARNQGTRCQSRDASGDWQRNAFARVGTKGAEGDPLLMRDPLLRAVRWRGERKWRYRNFGKDSQRLQDQHLTEYFASRKKKKKRQERKRNPRQIWRYGRQSGTKGKSSMSRPWRAKLRWKKVPGYEINVARKGYSTASCPHLKIEIQK